MRLVLLFVFIFFSVFNVPAQAPVSWTSADMYLALRKLNVLGSVMYIAAHPDDENTRLLAYFSKDKLYRTGYLSMTRGDGGQNLIGNEQGIELGLIRTQELLAARRIDGAEQFFTRAFDFGYSKSPEETFRKWDKEKILSDVVWIIRKFQPDVIITRFPTTGEGGHGHHTASAILANEAFLAASDSARFPGQLKFVNPWQPKRILWNTFNFGSTNTITNDQFKINVGGYNPLLGKGYGEIAAESRSQHKSQGFGVSAGRGEVWEYFSATEGGNPTNDLMDDVELTWKRVKGGELIQKIIDSLSNSFDFLHPEKSVKGLVNLYQALQTLPDGYWKVQKTKETQELISQCSGLWLDAFANDLYAVQTDSIRINFSLNNRLGVNARLKNIAIDIFDSSFNQILSKNHNLNFAKTFYVPVSKPITEPYWLENTMAEGYFNVTDQQLIGMPDVQPAYRVNINLNIEGQDFSFVKPVRYRFTDPVRGELYEPLIVLPALVFSPDEKFKMSKGNNDFSGTLYVTSKKRNISATIKDLGIKDQGEVKAEFKPDKISFDDRNKTINIDYNIHANKDNEYNFWLNQDGMKIPTYKEELHSIKYDHIPYINYFNPVTVMNRKLDLQTVGKKIGYIIGAGDKVPEALEQMGYDVVLLTNKELSRTNLRQFDAIITGIRAYNTDEWLNNYYDKLMKYVEDGGNLIVQYNTSSQVGPVRSRIGPYNFNISRTRVTDENAPVHFLRPDHPVLNFPNKIDQQDFKGWVQERSIYHASDWDKKFESIFSISDTGENPDEGSLIIAKYGKGNFVYTGIVFFRELPAGVPGAYRLMANLIALNKQKAF